ncbi:MAG: isoprenylcysteine carboxylmethyltransferase family protein [Chloroflexi bacterium]|nr:isoprenylcysteine carboxylmethyltransferase family protein [Chloroflexota bacterium]
MDVNPNYSEETTKDTPGVIALPPRIYLVAIVIGVLLHLLSPVSIIAANWLIGIGLLMISLSLLISVRASREFEQAGTAVNPHQPATQIVQTGLFCYSRNPMYVGLTGLQLGITLALNSIWGLLLLIPTLLIMHYGVILREEAYMERTFGQDYLVYKQSVRRWF